MDAFRDALILTGPTGSGKSTLAIELAPKLNAEIIAMDSMTLYRGMDIGTAKPTLEERSLVPHHLIDVLDPWQAGDVAWWLNLAAVLCRAIGERGKRPLFVGGTPFYLKALLHGLFEGPPASAEVRARLEHEAEVTGKAAFHARLAAVDPATANRLHPNDVRRVVRALEVWELTGKPISAWQQQGWWEIPVEGSAETSAGPPRCLVVDVPRAELYTRINRRVESMFAAGWPDEVERLRRLPRPMSRQAAMALGYREMGEYLDGLRGRAETVELIQTGTRQFAKRQLTWFRHLPGCEACEGKLTLAQWTGTMVARG